MTSFCLTGPARWGPLHDKLTTPSPWRLQTDPRAPCLHFFLLISLLTTIDDDRTYGRK